MKLIAAAAFTLVALLESASAEAQTQIRPLSLSERKAICNSIYYDWLKYDGEVYDQNCKRPLLTFYKGNAVAPNYTEYAVIGILDNSTHICKIYSNNAQLENGQRAFEIENCTSFAAPGSCSDVIKIETAKTLVRKYPTIAHSFSVADPILKSSNPSGAIYTLTTSDEVESELWSVTVEGSEALCKVKSIRNISNL